jgi:hypothetical protein
MSPEVRAAFESWPPWAAQQLAVVRQIAYAVAEEIPETGGLREYLAWGQPSLRPRNDGVGTAIRLAIEHDDRPAMLVHCGTSLVSTFKMVAGHLEFQGKRAVLFARDRAIPEAELHVLIELAFTSKLRRLG